MFFFQRFQKWSLLLNMFLALFSADFTQFWKCTSFQPRWTHYVALMQAQPVMYSPPPPACKWGKKSHCVFSKPVNLDTSTFVRPFRPRFPFLNQFYMPKYFADPWFEPSRLGENLCTSEICSDKVVNVNASQEVEWHVYVCTKNYTVRVSR